MSEIFDVAVIGNGMIGAAASRYLSAAGLQVAAVGPSEPANWKTHEGAFASHYDEGRITPQLKTQALDIARSLPHQQSADARRASEG